MCGIAGIATSTGVGVDGGHAAAMISALGHRGPDDEGVEVREGRRLRVELGATRLAVRDLSHRGHQPMVSGASGAVVTLNGEIYNADALRAELSGGGRLFNGSSDTEVVLAAYDRWGDGCWRRLRGMFAVSVWDPRIDALVLARDPLGVKPLYYAMHGGRLAFASEVRALLEAGAAPRRLSILGLERYLATGAVAEPWTIIEGIEMLPAGTTLRFDAHGGTPGRFWTLDEAFGEPLDIARPVAVDRLRTALDGAVRRQLVSDAPLGVFLSGGIDSAALVGLAATVDRVPQTASIVFAEPDFSEAPYIRAVCQRWGTEHHEVELTADEFAQRLGPTLEAMDQPTVDGVNTYAVSALAREAGLTVALSGLGGDELFAGYPLFRSAPQLERLRPYAPRLPPALARRLVGLTQSESDRAAKLARWLSGASGSAYALQRELIEPVMRKHLLGDGMIDPGSDPPARDVNDISRRELAGYMRNQLLRDADVMSMAHGLEVRVPLLDQELVEQVARLPGDFKTDGRRLKPLLVDAVRDLLPDAVVERPKAGFTLPFETWLRGPLREVVRDSLLDARFGGQVAAALNPSAVAAVWHRFEGGQTSWTRPWAIHVAKVWGQRHVA